MKALTGQLAVRYSSFMTGDNADWRLKSKCRDLTPDQIDAMFFPGPGGKSKKAEKFCSNCPVLDLCLTAALNERHTEGFWAGTTADERAGMRRFRTDVNPFDYTDHIPAEAKKPAQPRRGLRPVNKTSDTYETLVRIEGPSEFELLVG